MKPEEVPERYFENQQRLARERGHGDIEITPEMRAQLAEVVATDQATTLDTWIDYLASPDATYPDWLKYYAIRSVLGMGPYDKEAHRFSKRTKDTTNPFPDLNREALAYVLDAIEQNNSETGFDYSKLAEEDREQFEKLLTSENFAKLYAFAIEKVTPASQEQLKSAEGKWMKYDRGSDHMPLVQSLQGHGTGWCTAGESTAKAQLDTGDFYVYYTLDQSGQPTIPRVAIRMQEGSVAEVRGIAADQNLDPDITPVVQEKLKEFPDGEKYQQKSADMEHLTAIDRRVKKGEELTKDDLWFLYEIDHFIEGFGYQRDPRIAELLQGRDTRTDLSTVFGVPPERISLTREEALSGNIAYHYGNLNLYTLTSAEGLKLPDSIGGSLGLQRLTSAEGLKLPDSIGGFLDLSSLTSAEGLKLPDSVGGTLNLRSLTSAEGLKLPDSVGGTLNLDSLTSAEGLKLPDSIGVSLGLQRLTSAEGLKLPDSIGGFLDLSSLTSAEGLNFPRSIGDTLYLGHLISAEGLTLPESIGDNMDLHSLTSAEGLNFPRSIGGTLYLGSLTSAKGLKLPESVGGNMDLHSLTSAEGLKLPDSIGGDLNLDSLTFAEKERLRGERPDLAGKIQ